MIQNLNIECRTIEKDQFDDFKQFKMNKKMETYDRKSSFDYFKEEQKRLNKKNVFKVSTFVIISISIYRVYNIKGLQYKK